MGRKKKAELPRKLNFHISEEMYQRGLKDKAVGFYADKYESELWTYVIWLGLNCYEKEVLKIELRSTTLESAKTSTEPGRQAVGE